MKTIFTLLTIIFSTTFLSSQFSDNCDPSGPNSSTFLISCGILDNYNNALDNGGNTTTSEVNSYPSCFIDNEWTGPEYKYLFTAPYNGNFTFDLEILGNVDLDMLLLSTCNPSSCFNGDGATSSTTNESATISMSSGQSVVIVIDGWQGAFSQYNFIISCNQTNTCNQNDLECGETKVFSNISSGNDYNWQDYSCVSSGYGGNDVVIKFERTSSYVTNWITLWNYSLEDIDLFVLDDCYGNYNSAADTPFINCIASSTNNDRNCSSGPLNYESVGISGYPAGTYYIVIDGKSSSEASNQIFVSLSCEGLDCDISTTLTCDNPITSNNNTPNRTSNYYGCYNPNGGCFDFSGSWTGGERIFKFTAPEDGEYTFCMDPTGNIDLELFLFNSCCSTQWDPGAGYEVITDFNCFNNCEKAGTASAGVTETISDYPMDAGDMVWLVVDGFLGDEGQFVIEAKCNTFDCDDVFSIQCHQTFDDSNDPNSNIAPNTKTTDIFDDHNLCNLATDGCKDGGLGNGVDFERSEVVYYFDGALANNKDVVIDIFPRNTNLDVDLFVYEECNADGLNDCLRTSTFGAQEDDSVILQDVGANEEYYVVVDGQSDNPTGVNVGRFGVSITCGKLQDHTPIPMECGTVINGNTSNSNNWVSYYCNCPEDSMRTGGGNNGKEDFYSFEVSSQSNVIITLDPSVNQNLELYLLNDIDINTCRSNSRNSGSANESIEVLLDPGTYYIVVEGHDGDEGMYELTLDGCHDPCEIMTEVFCEDFQNYTVNQPVNLQSNDWIFPYLFNNEPDCKIKQSNGNKYLNVENEGQNVCGSAFKFVDNSGADMVELSCKLYMPYYNFGNFPLKGDGAELSIYEEDEKSVNLIYLAFRPYSDNNVDDRSINLNITDKYFSPNSDEPFAFNRNGTNSIRVRLQKSTQTVSVYINDDLVKSVANSGMTKLGMIGFRSVFNENLGFRVDDICLNSCRNCPGQGWYVTDELGNPPCNDIKIKSILQNSADQVSVTVEPGESISGDFIRWEIRDGDTEQVIETSEMNGAGYNYCCYAPGKKYYICYWYRDVYGCLQFCCIKLEIPISCNVISPQFTGGPSDLSYQLTAENLDQNQTVTAWFDSQTDENIGDSNSINYIPSAPGTRYICCLVYDSSRHCYILCCRRICVENPFSCNSFTTSFNPLNNEYLLSAPVGTSELTWFLDSPVQAVIGNNNPQSFRPSTYNITLGVPFQISYRYRDANGCWRFCCRTITPETPTDPLRLHVGEVCGTIGSTVKIPITCENFKNISQGTFSVNLSNNFASILGFELGDLPPSASSNKIDNQTMVVNWLESNTAGVTLSDGSTIGYILVKIDGNGLQSSSVRLTNNPAKLEFINFDLQPVALEVTDGEVCLGSNFMIAGDIMKPSGIPVNNVTINLTGDDNLTTITSSDGQYTFDLSSSGNYTVTPKKDMNDRNGIGGIDLLILQRHLLAIKRIESGYIWAAADLNNDNTISGIDLILLQRMILFITPEFQFVDSWKFVDKKYSFPATNPITTPYPEKITFNPLTTSVNDADFIAIKMGDLDESANPSLVKEEKIIQRTNCQKLIVNEADLQNGDVVEVNFKADTFNDIAVLTSEIKFNRNILEYDGFISSSLPGFSSGNLSTALIDEGYLLVTWVSSTGYGENLQDSSDVFKLRFNVKQNSKLSEALDITNDNLTSELINGNLEASCLKLQFEIMSSNVDILKAIWNVQAYPNPFTYNTFLEINTFKNESLRLEIFNAEGKLLRTNILDLNPGHNKIEIIGEELILSSGLIFYKLTNPEHSYYGKLLFMQ